MTEGFRVSATEHARCGYSKPCSFCHLKTVNRDEIGGKHRVALCLFPEGCNQQVWMRVRRRMKNDFLVKVAEWFPSVKGCPVGDSRKVLKE